ncbi:alpha/beta fold hydrolase [Rhodococcus daqingensis]|uniref:Alpha/beta fold hydrolase n=1 Tax=Rhodococcus daqingensis TaxID=2479363 RepID=A0ABW2RRX5_9NOCA
MSFHAGAGGVHPTWFGPQGAPLFGHVHVPEGGRARGGVVLCPPIGMEHVDSYRGLAYLAQQLCAEGLLVLRFDYHGFGDSSGHQDAADAASRWQDSVCAAVAFVRSCGVDRVALTGLRVGALLAGVVARQCGPLTALALWDPVIRGRTFLHQQRALYAISFGADDPADPRVPITGAVLHANAASELAGLDLLAAPLPDRVPVLLARRPEDATGSRLRRLAERSGADELAVHGQEKFIEPGGFDVVVPTGDVDAIGRWLADRFPAAAVPVTVAAHGDALVDGGPVRETVSRRGSDGLFTIETAPVGSGPGGPTVLLYATANEHRIGPTRLWVELARDLAALGLTVVRFDRRGTGDTDPVAGAAPAPLYSAAQIADASNAVRSLAAPPAEVLVAGLCSGSWGAALGAADNGVRAAVLVNPLMWATRPIAFTRPAPPSTAAGPLAAGGRAVRRAAVAVRNVARAAMPYRLWLLLGELGLTRVPEVLLTRLAAAGVSTTVLLAPEDTAVFDSNRGPEGLARLRRRGWPGRVRAFEAGNHSLYDLGLREQVRGELMSAITDEFAMSPSPAVSRVASTGL